MKSSNKGFTLIEFIFVIITIGILTAVAISKISESCKRVKDNQEIQSQSKQNKLESGTTWN